MKTSHPARQSLTACMWAGLAIINFALFLHPMSPENFLALAFSDPLQTVDSRYGSGMAIIFWIGLSLAAAALLGLLGSSGLLQPLFRPRKAPSQQTMHRHA